jgi:ketosteroid isomerase-like protein
METPSIQDWLQSFRKNWKRGNVEEVLQLFTDDVDYWETPSKKLDLEELREEWKTVKEQEDIRLKFEVFSQDKNKYTVQWELSYIKDGEKSELKGVYLIKLNKEGRCEDFWQYLNS